MRSRQSDQQACTDIIELYEQTIRLLCMEKSPGKIRIRKGMLVEEIAKRLVLSACTRTGLSVNAVHFKNIKYNIPLHDSYVKNLSNSYLKKYLSKYREKFFYRLGCDVQCYYGDKFLLAIECKSYTENAMLKRVLVDFSLLKNKYPHTRFALLQLESMLGGDYSHLKRLTVGSKATHTIMSYFDVQLQVITLLKGERNIKKPIHDKMFFKELQLDTLDKAIKCLSGLIQSSPYLRS